MRRDTGDAQTVIRHERGPQQEGDPALHQEGDHASECRPGPVANHVTQQRRAPRHHATPSDTEPRTSRARATPNDPRRHGTEPHHLAAPVPVGGWRLGVQGPHQATPWLRLRLALAPVQEPRVGAAWSWRVRHSSNRPGVVSLPPCRLCKAAAGHGRPLPPEADSDVRRFDPCFGGCGPHGRCLAIDSDESGAAPSPGSGPLLPPAPGRSFRVQAMIE